MYLFALRSTAHRPKTLNANYETLTAHEPTTIAPIFAYLARRFNTMYINSTLSTPMFAFA